MRLSVFSKQSPDTLILVSTYDNLNNAKDITHRLMIRGNCKSIHRVNDSFPIYNSFFLLFNSSQTALIHSYMSQHSAQLLDVWLQVT